jgi:hypothetical protein
MANTGNLWPVAIGVGGTLAGALISALIALWNARNVRMREEAIFARTQDRAQEERVRAARALVYEEWLRALRSFMERADADGSKVDAGELVDEVAQIFDRLELHASDEVRRAAAGELDVVRAYSASLTERWVLAERLRGLHESMVGLMRHDLA